MTAAAPCCPHTRLFSIELVESEEIGTVGVGEATIPSILQFNRGLKIDEAEFMRATQGTLKLAIEFADWNRPGDAYMHPFGFYGVEMEGVPFHHFWLRHRAQGGELSSDAFSQNIIAARAGRFGFASDGLPPAADRLRLSLRRQPVRRLSTQDVREARRGAPRRQGRRRSASTARAVSSNRSGCRMVA
jgi:hypothetical protein